MSVLSLVENGCAMDRRDFLKKTSAAAAATAGGTALVGGSSAQAGTPPLANPAALAAPAAVRARKTISTVVPDAAALNGPSDNARRLFRDIETATDGRYRFELTSGNAGAPGFRDILSGNAEAVFASPHEDMTHHKAFAYFAGLPAGLGLDAAGLQSWLVMGGSGMWDELADGFAIKSLLAGHLGSRPALWATARIDTLEDLKSKRLNVPGLGHDVLAAMGIAFPSGYRWTPHGAAAQLTGGQADAAEVGGAFTALQSGIAEQAAYAYDSGINPQGSALALHISAPVWAGMTDTDRLIVSSLTTAAYQASLTENLAHEALSRNVASKTAGVAFAPMPVEISAVMTGVAGALVAHAAATDRLSQRINARYMAFKRMLDDAAGPAAKGAPIA